MSCPACKNENTSILFGAADYISSKPFDVYLCQRCGLAVTGLHFDYSRLASYYGAGYYGQRKSFTEDLINYARARKTLRSRHGAAKPTLLDVGCGNGSFVMKMRALGWSAFGTEIAPPEHLNAAAKNFIYVGNLRQAGYAGGSFDVVTMWHFLEHVDDPVSYLNEAAKVLRPGGILLVEVPNFQSWQAQIFKADWFHLDVPRHTFHFSPASLSALFLSTGFEDVSVRGGSYIYSFFGWLQSFLNIFSARKNLFFDLLNGKISFRQIYDDHKADALINVAWFLPALFLSAVLFLAELLSGKCGVILVCGRKAAQSR